MSLLPFSPRPTGPSRRLRLRAALLAGLALLAGCSTIETRHRDWTDYHGPGAEYFNLPEPAPPEDIPDPLEPTNRFTNDANTAFYRYLVAPVARGYRAVTPMSLRDHIDAFRLNVTYPIRLFGTLFQARWDDAGRETSRFVINTTVGLLGFFDPAEDWGLEAPRPQDVGRTLESWGWEQNAYIMLPVEGPSSDPDAVGFAGDTLLNPITYISWPLGVFLEFNKYSDQVENYLHLHRVLADPYSIVRAAWKYNRSQATPDFDHVAESGPSIDTLEAVYLSYHDPDFPARAVHGEVIVPTTGRALPYDAWLQPGPAPIVYVLPGLGGHRESDSALGLAEMIFDHGASAVTISNSMNVEFMNRASSVDLPGYAPIDARDVHRALTAIDADLCAREPGRITQRALMGISLGAFHAFYIAAHERDPDDGAGGAGVAGAGTGPCLLQFDAFVTINPPVRLRYGMEQLDALYRAPLTLPEADRAERMRNVLLKVLVLARHGLQPGAELPFERWEARYLIGLSFRLLLRSVLFDSQERHNLGVLQTELDAWDRDPAYREIWEYSWMQYFYAFALPYFSGLGLPSDPDELWKRCDLRWLQKELRSNDQVRVFTNSNDFLLAPEDISWLQDTFGPVRMQTFDAGGHLGNLYLPEVQDRIMAALDDQLRETRAEEAADAAARANDAAGVR